MRLQWEQRQTMFKGSFKREGWTAKHPFGFYFISNDEDDARLRDPSTPHFLVTSQGNTGVCVRDQHGRFETLEVAQAAAQQDFESRLAACAEKEPQ